MVHLSVKLSSKFLCTVPLQVKVYIGNKKARTQEGRALKQRSPNFFDCAPPIYVYLFIFKFCTCITEVLVFSSCTTVDHLVHLLECMHPTLETTALKELILTLCTVLGNILQYLIQDPRKKQHCLG